MDPSINPAVNITMLFIPKPLLMQSLALLRLKTEVVEWMSNVNI